MKRAAEWVSASGRRRFFTWDAWEPLVKFAIVAGGLAVIFAAVQSDLLFGDSLRHLLRGRNRLIRWLFVGGNMVFLFSLALRTVLWFRYRGYDSTRVGEWPAVTVLVPAYNEGETVFTAICAAAAGDYPADRLRIIAVDDGSTDDTYLHMERARRLHPDRVTLFRFRRNRGKRRALCLGIRRARTPYIVTVDSDTRLEPNALRELLTPLILHPDLGAVTGRIRIWNEGANLLTRMLKTNFAMAFDFTRAIQSTYATVFCTSGAFSAYRRSMVLPLLKPWLEQTFLGRRCTFGEDRSLANFLLRGGCGTVFQRSAVACTKVPETLVGILKMMIRWARSNIRESLVFAGFVFSPSRRGRRILPFLELLFTSMLVVVHLVLFYYFLFSGLYQPSFILRAAAYSFVFGFFYMLYYLRIEGRRDLPYMVAFSLFSSVFMVWIFTIAGLSLQHRGWSTR